MAQNYVEQTAWRLLRGIPEWKSLRYLELGCADGHMLEQLVNFGVESVRGTTYRSMAEDYVRTRELPSKIRERVDGGIDLNAPLPYEDASFDVVFSLETIEHIEGHRTFISEAARVLRPGGHLVLTTPNLHRLSSRLKFLMTGFHHTKRDLAPADLPIARLEEYHQRCVDFPTLHNLLWATGLHVETLEVSKVRALSRAAMVLWGPMWLFTRSACLKRAEGAETIRARKDLRRWLMSPSLLMSEQLCLRAVKTERPAPASDEAVAHIEMKHEPATAGH